MEAYPVTADQQLQTLIAGLQGLSERLALEARFVDAALVAGGVQAIRALRTRLEPPEPETKPVLTVVGE